MTLDNVPQPIIMVLWDDACTDNGWEESPDNLKEQLCITVGFKIKETKKHILIASTTDGGMNNARIQIPKKMILQTTVLKEKGPM
jgi:hypothetical protein